MASDASMSQTITFVAAVVAAAALAGAMMSLSFSAAETMKTQGSIFADQMKSEVQIINDPRCVPVHEGKISIYMKNVGDSDLDPLKMDIFLDGDIAHNVSFPTLTSSYWTESMVIEAQMDAPLQVGDHSIKVVMENGAYDMMVFRMI